MCPSNYYRFWDTARYLWKSSHFIIPLAFDAPVGGFPSEYRPPLWDGKTRMVSLPDGKKILNISLFVLTWSTNVTDRWTDGHWMTAKTALASHRAVKTNIDTVNAMSESATGCCQDLNTNNSVTENIFWKNLVRFFRIRPDCCYPSFIAFCLNIYSLFAIQHLGVYFCGTRCTCNFCSVYWVLAI